MIRELPKVTVGGGGDMPAQQVLAGIVERCEKRGAMTRSQREFCVTCLKMIGEADPLRAKVQGWIDMRRVAA